MMMKQTTSRFTRHMFLTTLIAGVVALTTPAWGQVINEDLKLLASDGATGDEFGESVAIDNGIIVVGAFRDDDNGTDSGAAYVFDAATGNQLFKLLPNGGSANDLFGSTVAIENNIIVIGASRSDDNGADSGSAYIFNATTGAQLYKLLPDDGAAEDLFGVSVAIDGGIIVISAHRDTVNGIRSGSAYIFDAATGEQLFKLFPDDGETNHHFSRSLAIDNGIVAVGAYGDDSFSGAVYLFDASTGAQLDKFIPNDRASNDMFGYSVDIDNGIVAVGSHGDDDNGSESGSAYLFSASTGVQIMKLRPNDGAANDLFAQTVVIDNGIVIAGTRMDDDNGTNAGSAYLFDATTGAQIAKLLPSDGADNDQFGWALAADSGIAVVDVYKDDDNGEDSGSVYIFDILCEADLTGDGVTDTLDFLLFLGAYATSDPLADWNKDGQINTLDFLAYLSDWAVGCF